MSDDSVDVKLARIDERLRTVQESVEEIQNQFRESGRLNTATFVTQQEFRPVKQIVYGLVGTLLTGVVIAVLAMVMKRA